jgi:hypothetical protein
MSRTSHAPIATIRFALLRFCLESDVPDRSTISKRRHEHEVLRVRHIGQQHLKLSGVRVQRTQQQEMMLTVLGAPTQWLQGRGP